MFQWFYWHMLLPGRDIPGMGARHAAAGKQPSHADGSRTTCRRERKELTMLIKIYAGTEVTVNDEGFFTDPDQWTRGHGTGDRRRAGINALTEPHWQVIKFMRHEYAEKGTGPSVRALSKTSGVSIKELYELFPKGPAKLAAKIAGIPKPRGCI